MITLQFVDGGSDPGSEAIKLFSRGWCSHVDVVMPDGCLLGARSDEVGGAPTGVQIRPQGYNKWDQVEQIALQATPEQEKAFYDFLQAQLGKPYDKTAIIAFAFERDWTAPDSWFCSELAAAALVYCGWFPKPFRFGVNEITPRDLLMAVSPWAQ